MSGFLRTHAESGVAIAEPSDAFPRPSVGLRRIRDFSVATFQSIRRQGIISDADRPETDRG